MKYKDQYSVVEVAQLYKVSDGTVRRWIKENRIQHVKKINNGYIIYPENLENFEAPNGVKPDLYGKDAKK